MDKLITFAVPSYNSEKYLKTCMESLLPAGNDAEIIIVDDGSTDGTAAIADAYAAANPEIVRVIHKENGGHGSGVNVGIKEASGRFFKVVDSDDWLDGEALKTLMDTLRAHVKEGVEADLYIANFVYDRVYDGTKYVSDYRKQMPANTFFTWSDIKPLRLWKMLLMHSLVYSTAKLRQSGMMLPEHTFYVDNIYAYQPLPHMKKLFYLDVDLYHYYIGRADQSVTEENMIKRYDQQIRVMDCMLKAYSFDEIKGMDKQLKKLMCHCLEVIMLNTYFFTTARDDETRREHFSKLWDDLKANDKKLYKYIKHHTLCRWLNPLTWKQKGRVTTFSYRFLCKHVKIGV